MVNGQNIKELTAEEKRIIIQAIDSVTNLPTAIPPDYEALLSQTQVVERAVPTRMGQADTKWFIPPEAKEKLPVVISFHGGGFRRKLDRPGAAYCAMLCCRLNCVVVAVDHKLLPDYTGVEIIQEGYETIKWISDHADECGIDRTKMALDSRSAAGGIVQGILLKANKNKEFKIIFQTISHGSFDRSAGDEKLLEAADFFERIKDKGIEKTFAINKLYESDPEKRLDPVISPILATRDMLVGFPPTLLICGEKDSLHVNSEKYANKLIDAGVPVTVLRGLNCRHGFISYHLDDYQTAHGLIVKSLASVFYSN